MIKVTEIKNGTELDYLKQVIDKTGTVLSSEMVGWKVRSVGDQYLLYDSNWVPSQESFNFINSIKPVNTRIAVAHALKVLFSYESIVEKKLIEFTRAELEAFVDFLSGITDPGEYSFENLSIRQPITINMYLSFYRKYLDYCGKYNKALNDTVVHRFHGRYSASPGKYKVNKATHTKEVPRYISLEDYEKIIKIVRKKYSKREECIVRLMFEGALRIGEVLGLTNEDIRQKKIDGEYKSFVYIRNRVTDKRYQRAKTCMKAHDKMTYLDPAYKMMPVGYQMAFISDDLYDLICEYIEEAHAEAYKKAKYKNTTYADAVVDEKNFYIWLNDSGGLLSGTTWNRILKNIFKDAGITIDSVRRKDNLNHRFRHGFAMFQVQYMGLNALELAKLMRHKSIHSTMVYFQPTVSDKVHIKTEFTESLYDLIPSIKRGDRH